MSISLFCRLSEAHPQAISALQCQVLWFIWLICLPQNILFSYIFQIIIGMICDIWNVFFQYRMCSAIMELSNALIYGNRLHCGSSAIANAKLKFSITGSSSLWLKEVTLVCFTVYILDSLTCFVSWCLNFRVPFILETHFQLINNIQSWLWFQQVSCLVVSDSLVEGIYCSMQPIVS